jgi:predicted short-subunit dehydrogenase-like oxidoreductase (DUF2520 family)
MFRPSKSMKCNIIGAGRLGKNIALALSTAQIISSLFICNRSLDSAQQACLDIGFGSSSVEKIEYLPTAELTWICCNDDAINDAVRALNQNTCLEPGSFVIHCSGVLNSTLLAPLKERGCSVASFHPLKAFKTNYLVANAFNQVDCVLEGDDIVCDWLGHAFTALGANPIALQPGAKTTYHAAACIASNYLITLAACSEALFLEAGLSAQQSRRMMINLMQGNLNNLQNTESIRESLTGPLARGDINTILLHLASIENNEIRHLYQAAALSTLPLTQLADEVKLQIKALLTSKQSELT